MATCDNQNTLVYSKEMKMNPPVLLINCHCGLIMAMNILQFWIHCLKARNHFLTESIIQLKIMDRFGIDFISTVTTQKQVIGYVFKSSLKNQRHLKIEEATDNCSEQQTIIKVAVTIIWQWLQFENICSTIIFPRGKCFRTQNKPLTYIHTYKLNWPLQSLDEHTRLWQRMQVNIKKKLMH